VKTLLLALCILALAGCNGFLSPSEAPVSCDPFANANTSSGGGGGGGGTAEGVDGSGEGDSDASASAGCVTPRQAK
jgi:hypothetical protein